MIFTQFMVRDCCEMFYRRYGYALVLVLFLLPFITSSSVTRRRRRPNIETSAAKPEASLLSDQIAESSNYDPNQRTSFPYSLDENSGAKQRHGKIVVRATEIPKQDNIQSLADSKTAEEYVHNALKLQTGINAPIPERVNQAEPAKFNTIEDSKPKFSEYQVYEDKQRQSDSEYSNFNKNVETFSDFNPYDYKEQTSLGPATQSLYNGYPNLNADQTAQNTGSNSDFTDNKSFEQDTSTAYNSNVAKPLIKSIDQYEQQTRQPNLVEQSVPKKVQYYVQAPTTFSPLTNHYHRHQEQPTQLAPKSYEYYESESRPLSKSAIYFEYSNKPSVKSHKRPQYYQHGSSSNQYTNDDDMYANDLPKQQILKQIEQSVNHYMKTLENPGKASRGTHQTRNPSKYRDRTKGSEKPYPVHQQVPQSVDSVQDVIENLDNVEFIYKARTRPPVPHRVPIDFTSDNSLKNLQQFDTPYQLTGEIPAKLPHHTSPFLKHNYREMTRTPYSQNKPRSSKLNRENPFINKEIVDGRPIQSSHQPVLRKNPIESGWKPIYPANFPPEIDEFYDSYSPKFNNNPEGYGFQHNSYKPLTGELKVTTSTKRPFKLPKRGKRGGAKGSIKGFDFDLIKDPEANIALRPPPY